MSHTKHKIVGEGTYGCVVKPALPCKTSDGEQNKSQETNILSKILRPQDAEDEMREIRKLKHIPDIEQYIIRFPKSCAPKYNAKFIRTVHSCKNEKIKTVKPHHLRLLQIEDGGVDLEHMIHHVLPTMNKAHLTRFFCAIITTIEALVFFRKHHVIHHDIKSLNIVYNVKTGLMKYIDFGMMTNTKDFIKRSKKNRNHHARSWSYFPRESSCLNRKEYEKCTHYHFLGYDTFLQMATNTFDGYCYGLCMKRLFSAMYHNQTMQKSRRINKQFYLEAYHLMAKLCVSDLSMRESDYDSVQQKYVDLLKKYHLYTSNGSNGSNGSNASSTASPVNNHPSISTELHSLIDKYSVTKSLLSREKRKKTIKKVNSRKKRCPNGTRRNNRTGKCETKS